MKALTFAAMAASALVALAAPSLGAAQPYDHQDRGGGWDHRDRGGDWGHGPGGAHGPGQAGAWDINRRIEWLQHRIDRGRDDGSLDRQEAWRVQGRLDEIGRDARRMRRQNGGWLRGDQRDMLNARLDRLNDRIRWLRHNDDQRPW
jgi:hypothetical protein